MGGLYRLGCTLKKLLRSKVIQGHLRAPGATNFIKQRKLQYLLNLNFFKVTKTLTCKIVLYSKENLLIILILIFFKMPNLCLNFC